MKRPTRFPDTPQALFTIAATHLLTMPRRCAIEYPHGGISCKYRRTEIPRSRECCAIGACIPNALYNSSFEGAPASHLIKGRPNTLGLGHLGPNDLARLSELATELQLIHDDKHKFEDAALELKKVAAHFKLTLPPTPAQ